MADPSSLPRIISVTARQTNDAFSAHKVVNVFLLAGPLDTDADERSSRLGFSSLPSHFSPT